MAKSVMSIRKDASKELSASMEALPLEGQGRPSSGGSIEAEA